MKKTLTLILVVLFVSVAAIPAEACTLWAAAGSSVAGGGTLIVKNRDWAPDHRQELRLVSPEKGYRFYGLFAVGSRAPGVKAGINERGLVVVSASASSIPTQERLEMEHTKGLMTKLLSECDSVDTVLAKQSYFLGPEYLLVADQHKIAVIEIGPDGKTAIETKENGVLTHTNHYLDSNLTFANKRIGVSSRDRLARIQELTAAGSFTMDDFVRMSEDRDSGPDNSIWRTGSAPGKERTLATWIVALLPGKAPELYVRLANPGETEQVYRLSGKSIFH